jgi:hypothetical protein
MELNDVGMLHLRMDLQFCLELEVWSVLVRIRGHGG